MSVSAPPKVQAPRAVRRLSRLSPRAGVLAVIVVALIFAFMVPLRTYMQQRGQLSRLKQQERVLLQQNGALQSQIRMLHDPAYLEQLARQCLGMVRPGEIGFTVVPKAGSGSPAAGGQANC